MLSILQTNQMASGKFTEAESPALTEIYIDTFAKEATEGY